MQYDESGLINLRARSYDAEIGRFIQIDNHYRGEADNVGTKKCYDYALNNPIHGYRRTMQGYKVVKDVDAALGIKKANPKFGKGGLPQIFVPNME